MRTLLVTGVAGFIGSHLAQHALAQGWHVIGIDSLNDYYDVALKQDRLAALQGQQGFSFQQLDLSQESSLPAITALSHVTHIVHLAAQAGVRYALQAPLAYVDSNVRGHTVMLEAARQLPNLLHFIYASSSSVYGRNTKVPFAETDPVTQPASLYAATKRSCELVSESYANLYDVPQTGLRFFTVYGPHGRPDMAYYSFAQKLMQGQPITIYGDGSMRRDFTYIADIIAGIWSVVRQAPTQPHQLLNLGNTQPRSVLELVAALEAAFGRSASLDYADVPPGDVVQTYADINKAAQQFGYQPATSLENGISLFADWFKTYYSTAL